MTEQEISYIIRGAIYKVYNELDPGLLENIYEVALSYQLKKEGLDVKTQVPVKVMYDNIILPCDYRLDILVEDLVIIELKSVEELKKVHHKQLLTYLKITNKHLGILVNFNTDDINSNIIRKINQ
ncbi:MAG: GxxExxY protein [Prevotella sp.]|nr:GxxExxY protein [Prevotella sp.]